MPKSVDIGDEFDSAAINIALDTLKIGKQALVFVNTKRSAEKTAEEISKKIEERNNAVLFCEKENCGCCLR